LDFTDNEREAIIPAIAGVTSMLDSIAKTPSITRLVLTSSMAAVYNPHIKEYPPGFVYTASDWSPVTREEGIAGDSMTGYRAGKKLAEQAAWEFIETHKPHFDLATMLEPMVFGPPAHAMLSMRDLNASNTPLWPIANGTYPEQRQWAPQCVDVRDVAEAHSEALLRPEAGGKRYILAGPRWTFKEVSEILWRNFEWAKERVKPLEGADNKAFFVIDGETATKELGFQYASLEKTIVDTFRAWIEIDEKERSA
jgi:nucleoside-diphosphate-sugar epimerase